MFLQSKFILIYVNQSKIVVFFYNSTSILFIIIFSLDDNTFNNSNVKFINLVCTSDPLISSKLIDLSFVKTTYVH